MSTKCKDCQRDMDNGEKYTGRCPHCGAPQPAKAKKANTPSGGYYVLILNGRAVTIPVKDATGSGKLDLTRLQNLVAGYIECAYQAPSATRKGVTLTVYVNEEGKLNGMPLNVMAPHLQDAYVGPVVVVGTFKRNGETVGLSADETMQVTLRERPGYTIPQLEIAAKTVVTAGKGGAK